MLWCLWVATPCYFQLYTNPTGFKIWSLHLYAFIQGTNFIYSDNRLESQGRNRLSENKT